MDLVAIVKMLRQTQTNSAAMAMGTSKRHYRGQLNAGSLTCSSSRCRCRSKQWEELISTGKYLTVATCFWVPLIRMMNLENGWVVIASKFIWYIKVVSMTSAFTTVNALDASIPISCFSGRLDEMLISCVLYWGGKHLIIRISCKIPDRDTSSKR